MTMVTKRDIKRAINTVIREKGRFPSRQDISNILGFNNEQTMKCMIALYDDGYLVMDGEWFRFSERPRDNSDPDVAVSIPERPKRGRPLGSKKPVDEQSAQIIEEQSVSQEIELKIQKEKEDRAIYGVPIYIIQFFMAIIGIGASIISVYYTTIWLLEFLPWAFALLLSGIMVGFSVSAFETVILFFTGLVTTNKTVKLVVASGFILLWVIVSFFSIISTVAGQYNRHVANLRDQAKMGISTGRAQWNIVQERKIDLQKRIIEQREQMTVLNKVLSGMSDVESRKANNAIWYETQYRIQKLGEKMSTTSTELDKIRDEESKQIEESKKTGALLSLSDPKGIPDFYSWMSNVTGIVKDKVQFWMSLFPAVFVDIIAPVALAVALFLRRRREDDQDIENS